MKCYIAVKETCNKPFIRIPCQLWSPYLKREIAGFKNQTKRTTTAWKNFQVMKDLKDFACLPKRKQINEVTIEVHKTTSGLEIGNFHSPRFLTQAQEGIQWNPQETNDRCNEKVILSPNTLLNWRISYHNIILKPNTWQGRSEIYIRIFGILVLKKTPWSLPKPLIVQGYRKPPLGTRYPVRFMSRVLEPFEALLVEVSQV